jgi:Mg2+/Co2+ transporter CorB
MVVDEYGELQGMITLEDIVEEIVGDIKDEHDPVATGVRQMPDGSFIVDGGVPVRDLNRAFDWELPDEEATTIAGLVIHEARMIPDIGQTFNFHQFQFEVLKKRKHQVTSIKMTPLKPSDDAAPPA